MIEVKIYDNTLDDRLPQYKTDGASGVDLDTSEPVTIGPRGSAKVKTGYQIQLPLDYELQIRPRSSTFSRYKCIIPNSPGTIDSDYRGDIIIALVNLSDETVYIPEGTHVAQGVLAHVPKIKWVPVDGPYLLEHTYRQNDGFGSTGI